MRVTSPALEVDPSSGPAGNLGGSTLTPTLVRFWSFVLFAVVKQATRASKGACCVDRGANLQGQGTLDAPTLGPKPEGLEVSATAGKPEP